jgi:small subunit ribosomal protein S7
MPDDDKSDEEKKVETLDKESKNIKEDEGTPDPPSSEPEVEDKKKVEPEEKATEEADDTKPEEVIKTEPETKPAEVPPTEPETEEKDASTEPDTKDTSTKSNEKEKSQPEKPSEIKPAEEKPKRKSEKKKEDKEPEDTPKKAEVKKETKKRKPKKEKPVEESLLSPMVFNKYDIREVKITDEGLKRYLNLNPIFLPHSSARNANRKFGKSKISVIERLINNMMRTEKYTGKKSKAYKVVKEAFDIIAKKTKKNPLQVLVEAIENSAPMEEITRLRLGGISVPKAVDSTPSRRLDIALRNISVGAVKGSHKNKKTIASCLANEIILASKGEITSFAVNKKEDIERVAASAR